MTKPASKQHIVDLANILRKNAISRIIICPGSRNAPLIQVFERDSYFSCYSIVDERSAGYVALGMAKQAGEAVAVVTTSGTAALNLAPAVAEAFHQKIPLVVLTADRPEEWPPQFGNQRINQDDIFLKNSKSSYSLPPEIVSSEELKKVGMNISRIIHSAKTTPKGPVHINVPLHEPLYDVLPGLFVPEMKENPKLVKENDYNVEDTDLEEIYDSLLSEERVLIVAGMQTYSSKEKDLLEALAARFQVTILAENLANLSPESCISSPERVLGSLDENFKELLQPELVVTFGGQVVSKKCRLFIQNLKDIPVRSLDRVPTRIFEDLLRTPNGDPGNSNRYLSLWKTFEASSQKRAESFFENADFCNLTACSRILDITPSGYHVHFGNSGTIRYSQLKNSRPDLVYYANRGTSGIDGSLSTAVGSAMVSEAQHLIILGDLSFVYDSNALWNAEFPQNLKIIVLNDQGGGIFRLLDGPDRMSFFDKFSVTSHPVSLKSLSEAFGIQYLQAKNYHELNNQLENLFFNIPGHVLLEVDTSQCENSSIFKMFYKSIHNQ